MEFLRSHLDAYAVSINRFDPNDRVHTVGASDVGQCERKVYWTKNLGDPDYGAPTDPDYIDSYGAKLRGTMFENYFWAPALKVRYGDRLLFAGKAQQTFMSGYLSATPDGMLTQLTEDERATVCAMGPAISYSIVGTEVMLECKTYDPRTNLAEAKTENVFQTHVQMGLVRETTEYKPTHSILSYSDASWWNEGKEFVIPFDPAIYENAKVRAARIMTARSAEEMQPEGYIAGGKECEYCPFTRACGVERRRVPDDKLLASIDPQFIAEITDKARAIKNMEAMVESDEKMLRKAQLELKERLREKKVRKVPGVVTWSAVKGKAGWDNAAIREAARQHGIDLLPFATEGEPSDRFQITLKG